VANFRCGKIENRLWVVVGTGYLSNAILELCHLNMPGFTGKVRYRAKELGFLLTFSNPK
jgi:hypothetical protein